MTDPPDGAPPTASPDAPPGADEPGRLRDLFRRTWELELLLSGAVLVALLQLPSEVDRLYDRIDPHVAGGWRTTAFMLYYYVKLTLYTLVFSFILHLCTRAYWVGLIGLDAVFPHGIRWSESRTGPIATSVYREELPGARAMIARADRLSSAIFAVAFAIVILFVISVLLGGLSGAIALLVSFAFPAVPTEVVFWTVLMAMALAPTLLASVDRKRGEAWDPTSRSARIAARLFRVYSRASLLRLHGTTTMTLATNLNRTALTVASVIGGISLLGLFIVRDVLIRRDVLGGGSYTVLPDEGGALAVDPDHYENLRPAGEIYQSTPSIPDPVVTGPYVRLFVPISARRSAEVVDMRCPDVPRFHGGGLRVRRAVPPPTDSIRPILSCLTGVLDVRLDGQPVDAPLYLYEHPTTGVRGLVAHLPMAGVGSGEHVLSVSRWPREDDADEPPRPPYAIRFWR